MRCFDYIRARSVAEVCALLAENGREAAPLAGGTDLLIAGRKAAAKGASLLVDISRIAGLAQIAESPDAVSIGPLATHAALARSPLLNREAPLLASAAETVGSLQIRNRGTVGGNVMNAAPCADTVPPLIALGAEAELTSAAGFRIIPIGTLFAGPYRTTAQPDELLTAIRFPKRPRSARGVFLKLGRRKALAISRLSVAAILALDDAGRISDAAIAPGAALPVWRRIGAAESMLVGEKPSPGLFAAAGIRTAEEMVAATGRRWSTAYKEKVVAVLVRRALAQCIAGMNGASR